MSQEITVMSFGYKYDDMPVANYVFDMRFLDNPFWIPEMKTQTGLDKDVFDYVMNAEAAEEFYQSYSKILKEVLPRQEAKAPDRKLVIAFGCTGGQHRSVAFAKRLSEELKNDGFEVQTIHRDMEKSQQLEKEKVLNGK